MLERIQTEQDGRAVSFPLMLAPREARSLLLSAIIPAKSLSRPTESICEQKLETLEAFEGCLFDHGRDVFGNPGVRMAMGRGFEWQGVPIAPIYAATIHTATGYVTRMPLTYYPNVDVSQ
jgi:hypothetical protein